ncbi:MAG: hypothetical protein ACR2QU_07350, partial [Gammaproteobacteria bacterium]
MNKNLAAILTICAMFASGHAYSDDLLIDKIDQSANEQDARPPRGATMASVENKFGKPAMRNNAVGDPPITRWEYGDFLVFFEYDRVI